MPESFRATGSHEAPETDRSDPLRGYSFWSTLLGRRSRRFGPGMKIDQGPFTYASQLPATPLTEAEEAALVFAACGTTGYALADLAFGAGAGGSMLAGLVGRTIASPDSVNAVSLVVTNADATYLIKRPRDFPPGQLRDLIDLGKRGDLTEVYRRSRRKIRDGRAAPAVKPGFNFNINKWSLYSGTYFLPVNSMTELYLNVLTEAFDESMGMFALDERNFFRPAGVGRFAKSKGGYLNDDPKAERVFTIEALEGSLHESIAIEQGMMLQNLGLMSQALGIGGFPNYARHPFSWFEQLGFRMGEAQASQLYGGAHWLSRILKWIGKDTMIPIPLGLERDGETLLKPYCPPYYPDMEAAVHAFVERKFGSLGIYRGGAKEESEWKDPEAVTDRIARPSQTAIEATVAYCDYIYKRYGQFPVYSAPFRTVIGYQATHVDVDFYDRFFKPDSLTETQRDHRDSQRTHGDS